MFSEQHTQQIMDFIRVSVSIDSILELVVTANKSMTAIYTALQIIWVSKYWQWNNTWACNSVNGIQRLLICLVWNHRPAKDTNPHQNQEKNLFALLWVYFKCIRDKPESVKYNGSLVKLITRVQQLCGNEGSIHKSGRPAAHLLAVDQDVFAMGPEGLQKERKRLKRCA